MGYALNAAEGESWTGDLLIVDCGRSQKNAPRWIFNTERMELYSHARRTKSCKKDSHYPPLCTKLEAASGKKFQTNLQKEKPEIQIQMLKLDKISGVLWAITCIGIMCLPEENSMYRRTILRYF